MTEGGARKDDSGKLRFDLIPENSIKELAKVFTIGAKKYDDRNWEMGMKWGRVYAAMQRHAWAWWGGEKCDQEDGQHHLGSVMWCAAVLMEYERRGWGEDDRTASSPDK